MASLYEFAKHISYVRVKCAELLLFICPEIIESFGLELYFSDFELRLKELSNTGPRGSGGVVEELESRHICS